MTPKAFHLVFLAPFLLATQAAAQPAMTASKTPPTQLVAPGGTATFTITVDNTGTADLINVAVNDPLCTTLTGPTGDDGDNVLETTEIWSYNCTVTNVTASFTNTAIVTADDPISARSLSQTATADVTLNAPELTVTKDPPTQTVNSGGTASFTITMDNTGNEDLNTVVVTDPQCPTPFGFPFGFGDVNFNNVLETTEIWSYTCTVTNVTASFTNTVNVTANAAVGSVAGTDSADVTVSAPPSASMSVSKTPATQTVAVGATATFTITVDNTGLADLSSVVPSDPTCTTFTGPTGDDGDNVLETTEIWSYTCTVTNVTAPFTNTVIVDAIDVVGLRSLQETDSARVVLNVPAITVAKTPTTQVVTSGGNAVFTITVGNGGNADLSVITPNDPLCTTLTGPTGDDGDNVLETTEVWSYTCTVTNVTAAFTNTVTVTGTPPAGPNVSDTATADVVLNAPGLTVGKTPPTQAVPLGGTATFTITADNTGTVLLNNIVVLDPSCTSVTGPAGDDGDGVLETNEVWSYTCTVTNVTASFTNTVTVRGTPLAGPDASGTATADVVLGAVVPALPPWALLALACLLLGAGAWALRHTGAFASRG